ncbi:MAG: hypothetical protein FJY80_11160 [Candidatus Aminicenantes bacterium]|nr:hypothetical protein [Candidatus Aminicenantes bacterium]
MNKRVPLIILAILLAAAFRTAALEKQTPDYESLYPTYEKMREKLGSLFQEKKFADAASLLEWALGKFPEKTHPNAFNLGLVYGQTGELQKGVDALQKALDRGVFYGPWELGSANWKPYAAFPPFQKIKDASEAARVEAEKKAVLALDERSGRPGLAGSPPRSRWGMTRR